ncbi:MAG TPA: InlB B-repeat-containing protein [Lachnospiraceae bacterium]|nr:InlB B-repeat-containing protein [Lachnospiraceae bacterium]
MNTIKRNLRVALLLVLGVVFFTLGNVQEVKAAGAHVVTFMYGTKINQQIVADGGYAAIPTDTAVNGYTFLGWTDSAINVKTDKIILGMYVNNVPYAPATNAISSVKKVNNNTSAPFLSWWAIGSPERGVPGETCVVRWYNGWTNELWKTEVVPYGSSLPDPQDPCLDGFEFVGWEGSWTNITEDRAIKAWYYRNYVVEYVDSVTGKRFSWQHIREGENGKYPESEVPTIEGYYFTGKWEGSIDNVRENRVIKAIYAKH